jgi:hypothetical protein
MNSLKIGAVLRACTNAHSEHELGVLSHPWRTFRRNIIDMPVVKSVMYIRYVPGSVGIPYAVAQGQHYELTWLRDRLFQDMYNVQNCIANQAPTSKPSVNGLPVGSSM